MKRGVLLLCLAMLLSACQQDPMIKLNSDVQASIEKKEAERKQAANNQNDSTSTSETTSSDNTAIQAIDRSQWKKLADNTLLDLASYIPSEANQLKQFSNGKQIQLTYADYIDEQNQLWQIRTLLPDGRYDIAIYRLMPNGLERVYQQFNTTDIQNHLRDYQRLASSTEMVLQSPLTVGTQWETDNGVATITALYETLTLEGHTYQNVIEVSTDTMRTYYAPQLGVILAEKVTADQSSAAVESVLQQAQNNVSITQQIQIASPTTEKSPLLQWTNAALTWKTNQDLSQSFTELFRTQKWLTQQVSINTIRLVDNVVEVDFTPGIVAAMNQHVATETAVIPAIVQTIAAYYQVENVKLTVNGAILAPDILKIPTNGVWAVNPQWLKATD